MSGVLEALGLQLGCQAIWPLIKTLNKLIRKMANAYYEAKEFRKIFKRQYETLERTASIILIRYDLTSRTWSKSIKDIVAQAGGMFGALIEKIQDVLDRKGKGWTWRVKWVIVKKSCKGASEQMRLLNDELLRIETAVRLEYEDAQKKKAEDAERKKYIEEVERKKKVEEAERKKKIEATEREKRNKTVKTGAAVGAGVGLVGGAVGGCFVLKATLKGAVIGGIAGALVGAVIGFGCRWYWG